MQHREDKPRDRLQKKFQPIEPREDETATEYMRRVNRITSDGIKEAEYEAKYGVQVIRNEKTGQITIKKRPKDEITELMKAKQKGKGKKQKLVKPAIDPKLAKSLIKQAIEETKKEQVCIVRLEWKVTSLIKHFDFKFDVNNSQSNTCPISAFLYESFPY